jgi:GH43 family beta-xylosidase
MGTGTVKIAWTFTTRLCSLMLFPTLAPMVAAEPPDYVNPIVRQRADPWVYRHSDGWYYFTASVPEYDRIELWRAAGIQDLGAATPVVVWRKRDSGPLSANIWAPEIHFNLYIAAMKNPWTIRGTQVRISKPEFDWETQGFWVNEGPAVIKRNGKVFITYSASATDDRYCIGMLTAEDTADLLETGSWRKSRTPVFQSSSQAGIFGPGHNSFTTEAGYDILAYHARSYRDIVGDPLYDPNRDTRVQVLGWKDDGTPDFGTPR